ncbi:MAG: hypothetical protein AAB578_05225, partial [Elusimicrobiota bacterium]
MNSPSLCARRYDKLIASLLASSLTTTSVLAPLASAQSAAALRPQTPSGTSINGAGALTGPSGAQTPGMNLTPSMSLSLPSALPSIKAQ